MAEVTVVFECETCWARADTADGIVHRRIVEHPEEPVVRRFEFPVVLTPSNGLFGSP
jgi:hypothetical protein